MADRGSVQSWWMCEPELAMGRPGVCFPLPTPPWGEGAEGQMLRCSFTQP